MIGLLKELKAQQISLGKAHAGIAKRLRENGHKSIARGHCIYLGEFRRLAFDIDFEISKLNMVENRVLNLGSLLLEKSTENRELTAELFAARAHIEHIHSLLADANKNLQFKNAFSEHRSQLCQAYAAMMNWEDSEISSIAGGDE
ncbi:hypothetical protein [Shewanella algae]